MKPLRSSSSFARYATNGSGVTCSWQLASTFVLAERPRTTFYPCRPRGSVTPSCVRSAANLGKLVRKRAPSRLRPCREARCHYRAAPTRLHRHSVVVLRQNRVRIAQRIVRALLTGPKQLE